ncbi:site-specific integrase [Streptomyces hygroscopicus]|uniref:site-specific integrase n=1 Tax=Streptomyces hygroscopicus TaxID=1912 RepID=UPI0033E2F713
MRNGEAAAVNLRNIVADDVYRITEQVNQTTGRYSPLKHRKAGDYRDVPLPAHVRQTIEEYTDPHGTADGYLLRHPHDPGRTFPRYYLNDQWQRLKKREDVDVPPGMVIYGFRHYFASRCLAHGIAITDVAEWMGHKNFERVSALWQTEPISQGNRIRMITCGGPLERHSVGHNALIRATPSRFGQAGTPALAGQLRVRARHAADLDHASR